MTSTANLAGLTGSVAPTPVTALTASPAAAQSSASAFTQSTVPALSPRVTFDPSAGEIIQYLNANGQVQSQIPSTTVVAYLKAGETSQGLIKPHNTEA